MVCRFCGEKIGYDCLFYIDGPENDRYSAAVHAVCLETAIEEGRE